MKFESPLTSQLVARHGLTPVACVSFALAGLLCASSGTATVINVDPGPVGTESELIAMQFSDLNGTASTRTLFCLNGCHPKPEAVMKILQLASILVLFLVVTARQTRASVRLFSVDTDSDQLVQIDAANGSITPIGSLGFDATNPDLVAVGARLFLIDSVFQTRVDLHEINPLTNVHSGPRSKMARDVRPRKIDRLRSVFGDLVNRFS